MEAADVGEVIGGAQNAHGNLNSLARSCGLGLLCAQKTNFLTGLNVCFREL